MRVDGERPLFLGGVAGGVETWTNGSVSVSEITTADRSTYLHGVERRGPVSFSAVYSVLGSLDLSTTGRTGVGAETRYPLATPEPTATNAFGLGSAPARNATIAAAVDGVGETTVPRPEWVDEALAETADRAR